MQQRAVRRYLMELFHGRGKVGGVLMDGIEGEFLVKLGDRQTERRPADLNGAVDEFTRGGVRVRRRIAAEIRVEAETVLVQGAEGH